MAFTDRSDLFASIDETGVNTFLRHLAQQRPSLFNYATGYFVENPGLLCKPIEASDRVSVNGDPLFTEQDAIPVLGTQPPVSLNWCFQITEAEIDLHPTDMIAMPAELGDLKEQQLGLRIKACLGIDCPSDEIIEELLPGIEAAVAPRPPKKEGKDDTSKDRPKDDPEDEADPYVPFTRTLLCVCLELYATAHVEWDTIVGIEGDYAKPKLDGLELVDIEPKDLEGQIECYLRTVLKLGLLPRLSTPIESLILDITALLAERGFTLGKSVRVVPAAVPADVPNNPAIEDDKLKVFANLVVTEI